MDIAKSWAAAYEVERLAGFCQKLSDWLRIWWKSATLERAVTMLTEGTFNVLTKETECWVRVQSFHRVDVLCRSKRWSTSGKKPLCCAKVKGSIPLRQSLKFKQSPQLVEYFKRYRVWWHFVIWEQAKRRRILCRWKSIFSVMWTSFAVKHCGTAQPWMAAVRCWAADEAFKAKLITQLGATYVMKTNS